MQSVKSLKMNPASVVAALQQKVAGKYPESASVLSKKESALVNELFCLLESACAAEEYEVQERTELVRDFGADETFCATDTPDANESLRGSFLDDSDYKLSPTICKRSATIEERFTKEEMQAIVAKRDVNGWSLSTIMHNFRKVKCYRDVAVMRKILQGEPRKLEQCRQVNDYVLSKFDEAERSHLPIHESDLQVWAQAKASEIGLTEFSATSNWIYRFKSRNGIRSRKTTKFVTKRDLVDARELEKSAVEFRQDFLRKVRKNKYTKIFNADQVGINLEFTSNRTLRRAGAKDVLLCVRSKSNVTHSVTIMPVIDTDGRLLSPLFVCLQEQSGSFGPTVAKSLFQAANLHVTCSKSGKMNNELFYQFLQTVVLPNTTPTEKFLLVLDTWTPHKNIDLIHRALPNRVFDVMHIPPGTTATCQPLDTTFNRQVKVFLKRVTELSRHLDRIDDLSGRNNFLKLLSAMHFELSCPAFTNLVKYAWYAAGLSSQKLEFQSVKQVCFPSTFMLCEVCKAESFIVSAINGHPYCFECYFSNVLER
jgi:hypothetical protein